MPARETTKQRTGRIPTDYYKRLDEFARWRLGASVSVALAAVVWLSGLGWDYREWPRRAQGSRELASPGTLARVHATWDAECTACHVLHKPIDGTSWIAQFVADARASDRRCQSCHAGPPHHAQQAPGDVVSCAGCHVDHRGRDAPLVAIGDRHCTRCHEALGTHLGTPATTSFFPSITRFDAGPGQHPEFAVLRAASAKDPGTIKFDHALHMTRGLTLQPNGMPLMKLDALHEEDRAFYRDLGSKDDAAIQLRCDSCHRLFGDAPTTGGAYMLPIRYEKDCRACHPLDYDSTLPGMRHGLQLADVHQTLSRNYSAQFIEGHPEMKGLRPSARLVPGSIEPPEMRAARELIEQNVSKAERLLFSETRCGLCHTIDASLACILKANVPAIWLRHAVFDHSAHRAVGCGECHVQADPAYKSNSGTAASRTSADVMLPRISVCRNCHSPREESGGKVSGGAGYRCTECHKYHNGDAAPQGVGALGRDPAATSSLGDFLLGRPREGDVK